MFAYQEGRVGLMIRDSLDPGSVHASLLGEQSLTLYPTFRTVPPAAPMVKPPVRMAASDW